MGGLGRIIGGALAGLGDGLEQQTKLNYETTRDQMANERAIALAKLQGTISRDNTEAQYNLMDRNAGRDDARGYAYGTQTAAQKHEFDKQDIILKGNIDLKNDTTIEALRHTHKMSEDQYQSALDTQKSLTEAGQEIGQMVVSPKGEVAFYNKQGMLMSQTGIGTTAPPKDPNNDGTDGGTIADAIAARQGGGTHYADQSANPGSYDPSSTKPIGQKPVKQSILSQLSRMPPPPGGRVGATMTGPQGMKARWTGKQWELIGETVPRG